MDKHRAVVDGHDRSLTLFFENGAGARHGHFKRCAVLVIWNLPGSKFFEPAGPSWRTSCYT